MPVWGLILAQLGLVYLFWVVSRMQSRLVIWAGTAVQPVFILLVAYHAPASRIYICETLFIYAIAVVAQKEIRIVHRQSISTKPQTTAASGATVAQHTLKSQYVWLKQYRDLHHKLDADECDAAMSLEWVIKSKYTIVAAILDIFSCSTLKAAQDEILVAQFSAKSTPSADETLSMAFKGKHAITSPLLHEMDVYSASRILVIGGGQAGYLAYPVCHDVRRYRPSASIRFLWAVNVKPNHWHAPHQVLPLRPMQETTGEPYLYGELPVDDCTSNLGDAINDALQDSFEEEVMVLVLAPACVAEETSKYLRPRNRLLHHEFGLEVVRA
jgi:hypothetical protein